MSNVWFTADTHFGHRRIIELCHRPFSSVQEMDEEIISRWNARVGPADHVWHLGDFCWGNYRDADRLLDRLNGQINLIWGNHDSENIRRFHRWASSQPYREISLQGNAITLCHYSLRVWNRSHNGSLSLYGHSHGQLPGNNQSLDVGVDCWDFRPVSLNEILERMAELPAYPHKLKDE